VGVNLPVSSSSSSSFFFRSRALELDAGEMLRTFTRFFNFNFVLNILYFICLFNILSQSLHGVQAAPVHVSVGPEKREIGVSSSAPGLSPATVAGQNYGMHPSKTK